MREVVLKTGERAKKAALQLATASTREKNEALRLIAEGLVEKEKAILEANQIDLEEADRKGISPALRDRLLLTEARIREMAQGLREVIELKDPVGEVVAGWKIPNGLEIKKVRVPLGVVAMIYEARPNVTVDAAGLCLKSGNAVILRGSSVAWNSNLALTSIIREALSQTRLPADSVQYLEDPSHEAAQDLMQLVGYIDVLIPRGGEALIRSTIENAKVPVIETGVGNCHLYIDETADLEMAKKIVINAKCQRPGVCNAAETLLVHASVAEKFLPVIGEALKERGVEMFGCPRTCQLIPYSQPATEEDWKTEYLDLKIAIKVVESIKEAIDHINTYGTRHSEAIITNDYANARRFQAEVDAAAVYVNASTRFTDGGQFGMGAEIGISTQKLHARGPMSLTELTSTKFVIDGSGQIRE
jgi:glutamate-5-semialdehyde dehydrogenase